MRRVIVGTALLSLAAPVAAFTSSPGVSATTPPAIGTIYVADPGGSGNIFGYAPGTTGNTAPVTDITGPSAELSAPTTVAVARDGSLWIGGIGAAVEHFGVGATGDVAPIQNIVGASTGLSSPAGLTVGPDGSIWVTNASNTIERFASSATGDTAPLQVISGTATGLNDPEAIAFTPDGGDFWVQNNGSLAEFPATATGNVAPIRTISGANTNLFEDEPGLSVALDGSIWSATVPAPSNPTVLLHFAAGASGNATPVEVTGGTSDIAAPMGVTLDAAGDVWATDQESKTLVELPANATSASTPLRTISGAATSLTEPWGIAIYGYQPSAPAHLTAKAGNKKIGLSWSAPSATGGALFGYLVQRQVKAGVWTTLTTTTKTSVSLTAHNGTATHLRVFGFNEYGYGAVASTGATARTRPGTPRHLKAKTGTDSVTLSWTKPTSNGGAPIKKYVVTMSPCPTNGKAHCKHFQLDVTGSKHKLVVKHLVGRTYHFQVQAKNVAGLGPSTKKVKAVG